MSKTKLVGILLFFFTGLFSVFNAAIADYSIPVSHTHNGREHKHQLPKEGVYHRHGIGQVGKPIRSNNTVIYSNTTTKPNVPTKKPASYTSNPEYNSNAHTHAGRKHTHALPSQGVYHRHGNGQTGQRIVNQGSSTTVSNNSSSSNQVVFEDTRDFPSYSEQTTNTSNTTTHNTQVNTNWNNSRGLAKFTKSDTRCASNQADCNVCAINVKQQFQKAAVKQINWSRNSWDFSWPASYPPHKIRPLDIFDGDPKYALGIPDTHVQGFVRTNSRTYPYVGSHSHKRKGGIFVIKKAANGRHFLSTLHPSVGRHPSGVQIIGRYAIYGEGTTLYFKDIENPQTDYTFKLTAAGANFGGGLSIVKLAPGNHLLVTTGPGGQRAGKRYNRFYHLTSSNGRPANLRFINDSSTKKPAQWPATLAFSENMSLISECGTRDVYAIHTTGDEKGVKAIRGNGYWRLSKLVSNGKALGLTPVNAFTMRQNMKRCNVRAAATVSVNPQKKLEFLCHGYAKDPDGSGFNVLGKPSRTNDKFQFKVGVVR